MTSICDYSGQDVQLRTELNNVNGNIGKVLRPTMDRCENFDASDQPPELEPLLKGVKCPDEDRGRSVSLQQNIQTCKVSSISVMGEVMLNNVRLS